MIISKITGGLGNQMFQYAIAKSIAKKRGDTFKIDISFYPKQTLRKYELNQFTIEENIVSEQECIKFRGKENFFFKAKKKLGLNTQRPNSYFIEKATTIFDPKVYEYKDHIYLDGYWQNEKYFLSIKDELLKDFTLKNDMSEDAKMYLENILTNNSVSLHVRRGDYIEDKTAINKFGVSSLDYYKKAIKYIKDKVNDPYFYIFSDDIVWCKENFDFLENKVFIDETKSTFDDLELMKNCKHNIIANSTFSWWAAWLNQNENKIVISPKIWWKVFPDKNISSESWIKL